jgi:CheY-like chemotaxis protein
MARHFTFWLVAIAIASQCGSTLAQRPGRPLAEAGSPGEPLVPETNPAVLAAMELPRTEPQHYLSAVLSLVDLGRPELAAPILKELVDLNLNDPQRAELVDQFGSRRFLQLARVAALSPAVQQFAESCMNASAAQARDPQRLVKLIDDLNSPSATARNAARFELAAAGEPGVVATLEALAHEADPRRRSAIATAVVAMDPSAVDPLLGMLSTNDPALRRDVIRILKAMHVTLARPFIAAASSSADAGRLLDDAIGRNKRGMRSFATDENDTVALWHWDDATKKLGYTRYPIDEAQTIWAARLALEYAKLRPDDRLVQCQALVLGLEADGLVGGSRSPEMEKLLAAADGAMLNMVLGAAMKHDFPLAAATVAAVIGKRGDASTLYALAPTPAPLAGALNYPNRRVRFAALQAIMALDPQTPFPGASRVPETLGYFATGANQRRAVVAMPGANRANTLAGRLSGLGIEADPATRGGQAVAAAGQSADLEMVLVDVDIDGPGIRDVLYALRSEPATSQVPIGLLATNSRLDAAHRIASQHQRVVTFPRPQSDSALEELVGQLQAVSDRDPVTPQQRAEMAGAALDWLGQLLARDHTYYDLHRQAPVVEAALYLPALAARSMKALALLGTPASQRALADFASHSSVPIEARNAAAQAFAESVKRYGILLTAEEILSQYDRYNASASLDSATQAVLGNLLDTLESLRAQADTRRFR